MKKQKSASKFIQIVDSEEPTEDQDSGHHWRVLVVDDEVEVHHSTRYALSGVRILGRLIELVSVYSNREASKLLEKDRDFAVVLLDVVMETEDAGLQLVGTIRNLHGMHFTRIVLRTGQPGYAPELEILREFDINDYRTKEELTHTRLLSVLHVAIKSFQNLQRTCEIERVVTASRLATGVARGIQCPMQVLSMGLNYLDDRLDKEEPIDPSILREMKIARSKVDSIVSHIIELSGLISVNKESHNINTLVQAAVDNTNWLVEQNQIKVKIQSDDQIPELDLDGSKIVRVFESIINNSCQAMPDEGALLITISIHRSDGSDLMPTIAAATNSRLNSSERILLITFEDSGDGFDETIISLALEPYITTLQHLGGVGLGLSLCRSILEVHDGAISIENMTDGGARVNVMLPIDT